MHNSLAIKNLAIALEALSRINAATTMYYRVKVLLTHEVDQATLENDKTRAPKAPPPRNYDDDIPF
jgi:hypothetical protein